MTAARGNKYIVRDTVIAMITVYAVSFGLWMAYIGGWFWITNLSILYWWAALAVIGKLVAKKAKAEWRLREQKKREEAAKAEARLLKEEKKKMTRLVKEFHKFLDLHVGELVRAKAQLVYSGRYGEFIFDRWENEVRYFIENILPQKFREAFSRSGNHEWLFTEIDKHVTQEAIYRSSHYPTFNPESTGVEFEQFCASLIKAIGLEVRETPVSGDHGVDLIVALPCGDFVAIQCKMKASAVDNSAVQEVVAGKKLYQAQHGVVVSNNTYTPGARQLAKANNIKLLHFENLQACLKEFLALNANVDKV